MLWGDCLSMKKRIFTYIFSTVCGLLTSAALIALLAAAAYFLQMKRELSGSMAFLAFAAGCLVSGLICGLIKKHGGLKVGAICAAALLVPAMIVSAAAGSFTGGEIVPKVLSAVIASCTGAVIGVNRRSE